MKYSNQINNIPIIAKIAVSQDKSLSQKPPDTVGELVRVEN
jgi:hypothetical protein